MEGNTYLKMPSSKETKQQNIIEFMNLYEKAKKFPTKENFEALEATSSFRSIEFQYNKIEEEGWDGGRAEKPKTELEKSRCEKTEICEFCELVQKKKGMKEHQETKKCRDIYERKELVKKKKKLAITNEVRITLKEKNKIDGGISQAKWIMKKTSNTNTYYFKGKRCFLGMKYNQVKYKTTDPEKPNEKKTKKYQEEWFNYERAKDHKNFIEKLKAPSDLQEHTKCKLYWNEKEENYEWKIKSTKLVYLPKLKYSFL